MIVGGRQTLLVGVLATLIGLIGGLILGILAGAFGGWVDTVVMRIVDVMLSIPVLLLAISIAVLFTNPNLTSVIIAVSIAQIPVFARLLRGQMLAQRESDHVLAARALGRQASADRLPAHAAQLAVPGDRAGHPGGRHLDHRRGGAVVPRPRATRTSPQPEWGQMLGEAQTQHRLAPAAGVLAGRVHHRRGARLHPAGRVAARGHRPEEPAVTDRA